MWRFLFLLIALLACSCNDNCVPESTQCVGNIAEICGSDQNWREMINCDDLVTPGFECCWQPGDEDAGVPEGHTCLPSEECVTP